MDLDSLREVCSKHILPESVPPLAVFREPYIPYVPDDWNRVLVLAESQNLAGADQKHRLELETMDERGRIDRLYNQDGIRRVGPWDDGHLKMAVESLGFDPERTAVSNAVPWTLEGSKRNLNPDRRLIDLAERFWSDIMPQLSKADAPALVITVGKVARQVMEAANRSGAFTLFPLASSSTNLLARVAWLFDPQDLFVRYPEGKSVVLRYFPTPSAPTVLFACHVLSMKSRYADRLEASAHRAAL